jgi:hypothetical protein
MYPSSLLASLDSEHYIRIIKSDFVLQTFFKQYHLLNGHSWNIKTSDSILDVDQQLCKQHQTRCIQLPDRHVSEHSPKISQSYTTSQRRIDVVLNVNPLSCQSAREHVRLVFLSVNFPSTRSNDVHLASWHDAEFFELTGFPSLISKDESLVRFEGSPRH